MVCILYINLDPNTTTNITIDTSISNATIITTQPGDYYGSITVASNRTSPITLNINNLTFGNGTTSGCIDFGDNNSYQSIPNKLIFSGTNSINNTSSTKPAIRVASNTSLIITSDSPSSSLTCTSPNNCAGIGSGESEASGTIILEGNGIITSTGGNGAAGIGGGAFSNGGNITIKENITVNSFSGDEGAGIGGGKYDFSTNTGGLGGNITIDGNSIITAISSSLGAGIGGGYFGDGGKITIKGTGKVTAISKKGGAGIGGGSNGNGGIISLLQKHPGELISTGGYLLPDSLTPSVNIAYGGAGIGGGSYCDSGKISINSSANITSVGNDGGAGIGSGYAGDSIDISIKLLSPGTINATGSQYVSGIGSGPFLYSSTGCVESNSGGTSRSITISGTGIVNAYGGDSAPGIGGENACITILEGININAYGGDDAAGIGSSSSQSIGKIIIVGWGLINALGNGNIDIGALNSCTKNSPIMVLANPLAFTARNIDFKELHFICQTEPYTNDCLYLHEKSNNLTPYKTKTNENGILYFYADQGCFCFTKDPQKCCSVNNSFTIPPYDNILTEIVLPCYTPNRGINLFL